MVTYTWVDPVLFVGAAILTLVKQFVPLDGRHLRMANFILIFLGIVFAPLSVLVLYWPLLELIWRLQSAK
jgi:hypothetical protein